VGLFSRIRDFLVHPIQTIRGERSEGPSEPFRDREPGFTPEFTPVERDLGVNARGYQMDQVELDYGKWLDTSQTVHPDSPRSSDLPRADTITVKITYPDGQYVWRTFAGPFDDWDDVIEAVEDWFYDTEY
jgi:hypothetical protein